jgi:hypothetical protein
MVSRKDLVTIAQSLRDVGPHETAAADDEY